MPVPSRPERGSRPVPLPRFVTDAELDRLRAVAEDRPAGGDLATRVTIAWHLRQRSSREAVDRVVALQDAADSAAGRLDETQRARLALVRAEVHWLFAELDAAEAIATQALQAFGDLDDPVGVSDGHWLLAWIAADRGQLERRDTCLQASIDTARAADDRMRVELGEAALARSTAFRDLPLAIRRWGGRYLGRELDMHPALAVWIADFCAIASSKLQRIGPAVAYGVRMHEAALATGQLERAMTAASNIGFDLTRLDDLQAALEWMQQGLDLARSCGWPASVGSCLTETAETLRNLGRLDAAQALLDEALDVLQPLGDNRWRALALNYRGDIELDRGRHPAALEQFEQLQRLADTLQQVDLQAIARRGQAHALSAMGRLDAALQAAEAALALANSQDDDYYRVAALRVIATIHAKRRDREGAADAPRPLDVLQQALQIAAGIEGMTPPHDLLEAAAREWALLGRYDEAHRCLREAIDARDRRHHELANQRAVAMQIRQQTAEVRAEAEQHRLQASVEARRAETLQETSRTLERLGAVGQAITATLDLQDVLQTLQRHVGELLDATTLGIYLIDGGGTRLRSALLFEDGAVLAQEVVPVDHPRRPVARCARERSEILIERAAGERGPAAIRGSLPTRSALFAPLAIGDRLLGVITVQSLRSNAYGERERLIFRSLAAYGAIALDNAAAYRQIADGRDELRLLGELSARLQACPDFASAAQCLADLGPRLLPGSAAVLHVEQSGNTLAACGGWPVAAAVDAAIAVDECVALRSARPCWHGDDPAGSGCRHARPIADADATLACLPMVVDGQPFGLLQLALPATPESAVAGRRRDLALALAEQTALALANLRLREALREQSIRDPLTDCFNRRYLDETLPRELQRCRRSDSPLVVAMIDVDHFKRVNDEHGHALGDRVLRAIAAILQRVFRGSDVVCRYGGEEFLVVLPGLGIDGAQARVDGLLAAVRQLRLEHHGRPIAQISVSAGLALFPLHGGEASRLLEAADAALYRAKQGGRDRQCSASD